MNLLFKKRPKEEVLQEQYSDLMKKSFKKALKGKDQSDKVKLQAQEVYDEILELRALSAVVNS